MISRIHVSYQLSKQLFHHVVTQLLVWLRKAELKEFLRSSLLSHLRSVYRRLFLRRCFKIRMQTKFVGTVQVTIKVGHTVMHKCLVCGCQFQATEFHFLGGMVSYSTMNLPPLLS